MKAVLPAFVQTEARDIKVASSCEDFTLNIVYKFYVDMFVFFLGLDLEARPATPLVTSF